MKKIFIVLLLCLGIFVSNLTFINLNANTINQAVPTNGYIEKVYFNTELSTQEVDAILSELTYQTIPGTNYPTAVVITNETMTETLSICRVQLPEVFGYIIIYTKPDGNITIYDTYANWEIPEIEINYSNYLSTLAPDFGVEIQNDKLYNLISVDPFLEDNNPNNIVFGLFQTIGEIARSFGLLLVGLFESAVSLFWSEGNLTIVGVFVLIGIATGLFIWAFGYVRRLIRIKKG